MYHFLSGYTAKVAGTEVGVTEPQATFSACFGAPFMPLPPTEYAEMLAEKVQQHGVRIWLVNTGWTGGGYGVGTRMKLKYTRHDPRCHERSTRRCRHAQGSGIWFAFANGLPRCAG